jgi:hypothetical protein
MNMLITKEDAKKMDTILWYLVKDEQARVKLKQIQDLMQISLEESRYLYESILKYHNEVEPIISIHHASNIAKKPLVTESFLKKGGFKTVYEQQAEIKSIIKENQTKSNHKSVTMDWQRRTYWYTFIIAIVGFIMALVSMLIGLKIIKLE